MEYEPDRHTTTRDIRVDIAEGGLPPPATPGQGPPEGVPEGPPKGVRTTGRVGMGWYQELSLRVSMLVKACLNPFSQISDFLDFHIPPTPPLQLSPWHWCESTKICMSFCQNPKYSTFFYEMFRGHARVHRNSENRKSAKIA